MSQSLTMKIRGVYTFPNDYGSIPEGALALADNIVIDRESIAEPRRGIGYLGASLTTANFPVATQFARKIFFFKDSIVAHLETAGGLQSLAHFDAPSTWHTSLATFDQPAAVVKVRGTTMNQNLYLTGDLGVHRLDDFDSVPLPAGVPEARDIDYANSTTSTTTPTWLPAGKSVAYRVVWGFKDANANLFLGAPSGRSVITASSAEKSTTLRIPIPVGVTLSHFVQVYRSPYVEGTPNDEMNQVKEVFPTAGDLTAGYLTVEDLCIESLRMGAALYTNASQEGDGNSNLTPPKALDIATFRDCMFYANILDLETFELTLTGIGFDAGGADFVTIGDLTMQAGIFIGTNYPAFSVVKNLASEALNISATSKELVYSINRYASVNQLIVATGTGGGFNESTDTITSTNHRYFTGIKVILSIDSGSLPAGLSAGSYWIIRIDDNSFKLASTFANSIAGTAVNFTTKGSDSKTAYFTPTIGFNATYQSGSDDLPGKIRIRATSYAIDQFSVSSTKPALFFPALTAQLSSNNYTPNGLACSKPMQSESFTLANRWPAGSADYEILRILALRDSLFILKEDGVYRLYGTDPSNFQIVLLDSTANCIAPDTAVILDNQIFALTTQGVVTISENGTVIMSEPIKDDLLRLLSINKTVLAQHAFGVAYETDRSYYLFLPTTATDTGPTQYWRYNTKTNNWTHGTLEKSCGGVNPFDDLMYLGSSSQNFLGQERKTRTNYDYADYVGSTTVSGVSSKTVTVSSTTLMAVGMVIYQSDLLWSQIDSITDSTHVVTTRTVAFTNGTVNILAPISCNMRWSPATFSNPGINKQVRETSLLFRHDFYGAAEVYFSTDISPTVLSEDVVGTYPSNWGRYPWGSVPWGSSSTPRRRPLRVGVPRIHQRCSVINIGFQHECLFSPWALQGISLIGNNIGEKVWMEGSTVE